MIDALITAAELGAIALATWLCIIVTNIPPYDALIVVIGGYLVLKVTEVLFRRREE